jgi:hypothetical protein
MEIFKLALEEDRIFSRWPIAEEQQTPENVAEPDAGDGTDEADDSDDLETSSAAAAAGQSPGKADDLRGEDLQAACDLDFCIYPEGYSCGELRL